MPSARILTPLHSPIHSGQMRSKFQSWQSYVITIWLLYLLSNRDLPRSFLQGVAALIMQTHNILEQGCSSHLWKRGGNKQINKNQQQQKPEKYIWIGIHEREEKEMLKIKTMEQWPACYTVITLFCVAWKLKWNGLIHLQLAPALPCCRTGYAMNRTQLRRQTLVNPLTVYISQV